ncbi:sororin-like isoform X1 [Lepidochelys kempii]|uniref:sororin-like isoform X1 n=1 Tax=Lepidochelys kempii TaxID=8472 RepID=UPI003C6EF976
MVSIRVTKQLVLTPNMGWGGMSWKDSFVTITFPSKVIFTSASLLLLLVHMGIFGGDLYHFTVTQKFDLMSFHGTTVLLVSHVMSFYWALLATFYTLEANDKVLRGFALTSLDTVSPPLRRRSERISGSPTRRGPQRKPLVEKKMVGSPLPAPVVKRLIMVKKIMPRKQQPAVALTEAEQTTCMTGTALTPRRSPRISQKAGKENFPVESSEAKGCGSTDANPVLTSSLPANASGLVEKAALSTVSINVCDSPPQDERDVLMSKKVRRSYSRLDASPSLDMSTPTFAHGLQKKCSLFGFEKFLVPDALADVSPVGKVSPAQETPVEPSALGSTKEWDTNIPGISFPKEKRKKRRIPQIDKSELDEWAAQMNAEFEEAEQFDLLVE